MLGKKDLLANIFYKTGISRWSSRLSSHSCFVLNYHRIRANQNHSTLFDEGVFGPSQQEFAAQIGWLNAHFEILSESDLVAIARGTVRLPGKSVVITFDDGYIDNYTLAYPILRDANTPAIFFIPTLAIESRQLGWWDCLAYLLKITQKDTVYYRNRILKPREHYQESIHTVFQQIKEEHLPAKDILADLIAACEIDLPARQIQGKELMTWEQLREVSQNNIAIGSHTHSHRILASLPLDRQSFELTESKQIIEHHLGKPIHAMSYPVGHYNHFSPDTKRLAQEAGYDIAFSFFTGINDSSNFDPFDIRRIPVSSYLPRFIGGLQFPSLFLD